MKRYLFVVVLSVVAMFLLASCGPPEGYDLVKQNALNAKNEAKANEAEKYCPEQWAAAEQVMNQAMTADEQEEWEAAMPLFQEATNLYNQAKMCAIKKKAELAKPKEPVKEPPKPQPVVKGKLDPVFFDYDRSNIRANQMNKLQAIAGDLKGKFEKKLFLLIGYCDIRGTEEYNLALGERRATTVYNFLVASGVPATRLTKKSGGETSMFAAGETEGAYQENRRVEFEDVSK